MAATVTKIAASVLNATTASVTFSSIPSTYNDLWLRISCRSTSTTDNLNLTINSYTNNYGRIYLRQYSTTLFSAGNTSGSGVIFLENLVQGTDTNSSQFGQLDLWIPRYTRTDKRKAVICHGITETHSTTPTYNVITGGVTGTGETAAITSLTFAPGTGSFASGSTFYLYGVKNT